jgi:hypothetical protein
MSFLATTLVGVDFPVSGNHSRVQIEEKAIVIRYDESSKNMRLCAQPARVSRAESGCERNGARCSCR